PRCRARVHRPRARARARRNRRGLEPAPAQRADREACQRTHARGALRRSQRALGRGGSVTALVESSGVPTAARPERAVLLAWRRLVVEYGAGERPARAVDGIDLQIRPGEVVGLAGESGCGKTTVANAVLQLLRPPGHVAGGSVLFRGEELLGKSPEE